MLEKEWIKLNSDIEDEIDANYDAFIKVEKAIEALQSTVAILD